MTKNNESGIPSITGMDIADMIDQPWMCRSIDPHLSMFMKNNDYNGWIDLFGALLKSRDPGMDVDKITITCEGQCPKGCSKRFKLKLGKSVTKKSFEKMNKHGQKYPEHCFVVNYTGVVKAK